MCVCESVCVCLCVCVCVCLCAVHQKELGKLFLENSFNQTWARGGGAMWVAVDGVAQSRARLKQLSSSSRPGPGKNKTVLEYLSETESKNTLRAMRHVRRTQGSAKRHKGRLRGTPHGQI